MMAPDEIYRIRTTLGASQAVFAAALGYRGPAKSRSRQMRRLEGGRREINDRVAELAYWYEAHGLMATPPAHLLAVPRSPAGQSDKSGDNPGDIVT